MRDMEEMGRKDMGSVEKGGGGGCSEYREEMKKAK